MNSIKKSITSKLRDHNLPLAPKTNISAYQIKYEDQAISFDNKNQDNNNNMSLLSMDRHNQIAMENANLQLLTKKRKLGALRVLKPLAGGNNLPQKPKFPSHSKELSQDAIRKSKENLNQSLVEVQPEVFNFTFNPKEQQKPLQDLKVSKQNPPKEKTKKNTSINRNQNGKSIPEYLIDSESYKENIKSLTSAKKPSINSDLQMRA